MSHMTTASESLYIYSGHESAVNKSTSEALPLSLYRGRCPDMQCRLYKGVLFTITFESG